MREHPIMKALRGERTEVTPVWIMRQAGRYSKKYMAIREKVGSFMELCKNPQLSAQVTLIPIEEIGVDAAILFSDILVPVEKMGINVEFAQGKGPVLGPEVKSVADVQRLRVPEPEDELDYVLETIAIVKQRLKDKPLIGFSGAPFTLASYILEGGSSKNYTKVKVKMWQDEPLWSALMDRLTETVTKYLSAQIKAGVDLVQMFDSWAGVLSVEDYRKYALPYAEKVVNNLKELHPETPIIYFGVGTSHLLDLIAGLNVDAVGIDWRTEIATAVGKLKGKAVQGNLDPVALLADEKTIHRKVERILRDGLKAKGHIFNLGHGILPSTKPESARYLVNLVHRLSRELREQL